MLRTRLIPLSLVIAGLLSACGELTPAAGTSESAPPTTGTALPTEEAGAPLDFSYRILGNPIAGLPVAVELTIDTALHDRPIRLSYQPGEAGSLTFPESQAEDVEVVPVAGSELRPVQVTIVPARDGRIYLAVTATIETDTGSVRKAMAVPIMVEPAPLTEEEAA